MAQIVLGGIGGIIGGGLGQAVGSVLGGLADRSLIGALSPARQRGPRLETLKLQSTAEGAPMACVFGRARVTGQMIWAARFLEQRQDSQGGKGGPRVVEHAYSLSFAIAICEGPIDGIGRIWADGKLLNQTGITMRVHRGDPDQTPDPLIEAVEGAAPAYRGTAYVVFEDLPLGAFGNRVPQLSFEVFRRPGGEPLEEKLEGVCLIPGASEFVLATEPVMRRVGLTGSLAENLHLGDGRPDLTASLDQLASQCPNLKRVSLVIGWFGDDLRAEYCRVMPGVERRAKPTEPLTWSVAGLGRGDAHLISQTGGRPAYGGTPSDDTVRQAVAALKARGWAVTLYPFVFMDIPSDNTLPVPNGGLRQPAYPWRGRIAGRDGASAAGDVAQIFGGDWGLRRLALHYAALAAETGCAGLLIGSEMRGLTWTRGASGDYPAVEQYRALAAACRAIVGPNVSLSYAADWSEYSGHRPGDGSGDVVFHLDPLWADPAIDHVAIDWYPPLGDWREGDGGLDGLTHRRPDDPNYLAGQIAGGDGFDWYYADAADRAAQIRTPIVDTSHGEDWVFRVKDLVGWWSHAHHDRPGGVRSAAPTAWEPQMKPIRLTEFGCAAVDRGGNAPNLFQDPKSSESFLPPFSTGARDDRMQRHALEAVLAHFEQPANNPVSSVYGGPMLQGADAWCWDARPWPAFPALNDVWADAGAWRAGHWLNGRMGGQSISLLAAILKRGGVEDFSIEGAPPNVSGYVIDRPMRTRDALEPLLQALDMTAAERGGRVWLGDGEQAVEQLRADDLALGEKGHAIVRSRSLEARPSAARVRFVDEGADYQTGAVTVRADRAVDGGGVDADLPVVCDAGLARGLASRMLEGEGEDRLTVALGPLDALRFEAGDLVAVEGATGIWRIGRVALDETPISMLDRHVSRRSAPEPIEWRPSEGEAAVGAPFLRILDLPPLPGAEEDPRPIAVVAAEPWRPMTIHVGEDALSLTERETVIAPATVGRLTQALAPGVLDRWDEINALVIRFEGRPPTSATPAAVLGGENLIAVQTGDGWELMQFRTAVLEPDGGWRLSGLLRGQQGTEIEMRAGAPIGAVATLLDRRTARFDMASAERGLQRLVRVGPSGKAPGGFGFAETSVVVRGLHARPWSPARLEAASDETGVGLSWIPRARIGGDVWDVEPAEIDPRRFRVRILDGGTEKRSFEVEGLSALYRADDLEADFPEGLGAGCEVAVAQYGAGFGWGVEARSPLSA